MENVKKLIYKKHEFNIFPEMSPVEYERLKLDIKCYGFDYVNHPIMLYDNRVLDGFNRYRALVELNIELKDEYFEPFKGNDDEAMALVLRSNKRRNITPEQWAILLVKSKDILEKTTEQVKKQAKEKQIEGGKNKVSNSGTKVKKDSNKNKTSAIVAEKLDTTPKLILAAQKLEKENPEEFPAMAEAILSGETTIRKINIKKAAALAEPAKTITVDVETIKDVPTPSDLAPVELTEKQILKLVRMARTKIAKLDADRDNKDDGLNTHDFDINKKIESIQMDLGVKLTS